ncbi:type II toxin-antitoxin system RelE/ParE family toxin, partial [Candidatus Micrarchaeota archaeon]|nr:type II toxin-antitoxin system RelE/ParE family toxin [Candidatus Micrarchaeota archaeon]
HYKIIHTKEFSKDFEKIDKHTREMIKKKIEEVSENPERYKHLHYDLRGSSRIWVGKLRIVFSHDVQLRELYLEKVVFGHKY